MWGSTTKTKLNFFLLLYHDYSSPAMSFIRVTCVKIQCFLQERSPFHRSIKKSEDDVPVPPLIKSAALWGIFTSIDLCFEGFCL